MPISGVVILCSSGCGEQVAREVAGQPGLELQGLLPDDRIVAVIEADSVDDEVALVSSLQQVDGVISVQLAYHNFEDVHS